MNLLSSDSLQLITSAAQNTDVLVHWFDLVTSTKVLSASRTRTNITTATTTTILTAPAAGVERTVKLISIRNRGGAPNTVTLVFNDSVNTTQPISVTLQIGDSLHFNFNVWQVLDSSGQVKQVLTTVTVAAPHTHTSVDITDFTEATQDAVGAMLDLSLNYVDGTPLLQRSALTGHITAAAGSNSTVLGSFTKAELDAAVSDGNLMYVGDAPTSHTHTASEITNFNEAVDDRVNALLVEGTNITLTYDDGAGTITIDAAGGGGGSSLTSGSATLDFGAVPGTGETTLAITGQTGLLVGSDIRVWIQGETSTDHNAYEHSRILAGRIGLAVENVIAGTGFTIVASSELRLTGEVTCRWQWS